LIRLGVALGFALLPWANCQDAPPATPPASATPHLSRAEQQQFLLNAKVIKTRSPSKGITGTLRATLTDGKVTHDASIQMIDEYKARFEGTSGSEINFKDSYKFNLAAYRLDQMLGLNMMPVAVERKFEGTSASYTWWIDDVLMDEGERALKKITPPNMTAWNEQMYIIRVFDQLIYNVDRNLGNLLIDKDWRLWMIDHTRGFRMYKDLREPKNLVKCDRDFLAKMKELDEKGLRREMGHYLTGMEITGLLARRDKIVAYFEGAGPSTLYSLARRE
jgi:hypothetical protein